MSGPESLQEALAQARRERPAALPRDFSLEVMDRISRQAPDEKSSPLRLLDFAMAGIAAVIVGGAVSLLLFPAQDHPGPPQLEVFGVQGNRSPFATP